MGARNGATQNYEAPAAASSRPLSMPIDATTIATRLCALLRQGWFVVAATILMTTQPFITTLSKNDEGTYDYLAVSTTFVTEVAKLCISLSLYLSLPKNKRSHNALRRNDVLLFACPAFVYFINNNLIFVILMYVNSTTFQILSSLKTVATGILFRIVLKRILSDVQGVSILLLAAGAAVSQFPVCLTVCGGSGELEESVSGEAALLGASVALVTCVLSAFGGVYSELLLKKDGNLHSIHLQNMLLYAWGVLFNGIALLVKDKERLSNGGLFQGYAPIVLLLILNNACVGLAISAILKFANNLVRVFAHTAAMLLTMVLESMFMGAPVSPQLLTSIVIVSSSTYLYNIHPPPKPVAAKGMVVLAEMVQPDLDELEQAPTRKSNGSANGKANGKADDLEDAEL